MSSPRKKAATSRSDAVSLLKADHRQVETWFAEFDKAKGNARKQLLAAKICAALTIHTTIEQEIFYPAFLKATEDRDVHHEAVVEHEEAKKLIWAIETTSPSDDYFDARVSVLAEMIKHHIREEEKPGGMFAEAKKSAMDLDELGAQLRRRKQQLQSQSQAA